MKSLTLMCMVFGMVLDQSFVFRQSLNFWGSENFVVFSYVKP